MGSRAKLVVALLLGLAVVLGVVAYVLGQRPAVPLKHPVSTSVSASQGVPVVVAKHLLPAGKPILREDLELLSYPAQPTGAFSHLSQLVGKTPAVSIAPQVPVLAENLLSGLATHIAAGHVAMAIAADPVLAVGYHLHPGDWVDVFGILSGNQQSMQGGWPTQSRLLLSHLRVLAVGPLTVAHPEPAAAKKENGLATEQRAPRTVVLQVPVAAANTLALGSQEGHLLLALSNPQRPTAPDLSAFPLPTPAILPSKLPLSQQKQALENPANRAYAGETLPGLAGKSVQQAAQMRPLPAARRPTVQIITGGQVSRIPY